MEPQHSRQGGPLVVLVLLLSPLINLAINRALDDGWHQQNNPQVPVAPGHWLFGLATLLVAISVLKLGSVQLLLIGTGLYAVLNAIALFWYWCLDHPGFGSGQDRGYGRRGAIVFPEGDRDGTLLDYINFTVLSSNTLGPPENHLLLGAPAKLLQLLQSSVMLGLLVIVVARAINTLG